MMWLCILHDGPPGCQLHTNVFSLTLVTKIIMNCPEFEVMRNQSWQSDSPQAWRFPLLLWQMLGSVLQLAYAGHVFHVCWISKCISLHHSSLPSLDSCCNLNHWTICGYSTSTGLFLAGLSSASIDWQQSLAACDLFTSLPWFMGPPEAIEISEPELWLWVPKN